MNTDPLYAAVEQLITTNFCASGAYVVLLWVMLKVVWWATEDL